MLADSKPASEPILTFCLGETLFSGQNIEKVIYSFAGGDDACSPSKNLPQTLALTSRLENGRYADSIRFDAEKYLPIRYR